MSGIYNKHLLQNENKKLKPMGTILLYTYCFIIVMTLILWCISTEKIKAIGNLFATLLSNLPLVGIAKAVYKQKTIKRQTKKHKKTIKHLN